MAQLNIQRVRFSIEADNRLRMLKGRTGLTPNLLCRLGLCLSLSEPGYPLADSSDPSSREINRYTLLGEYDSLFVALLETRHPEEALEESKLSHLFIGHLHRGVTLLANRLKPGISIAELVASQTIEKS
jgi:DNA sulfur modification protein DndE